MWSKNLASIDRGILNKQFLVNLAYTKDELEEMLDPDFEFLGDHDLQTYKAIILSHLDRSNFPSPQVAV